MAIQVSDSQSGKRMSQKNHEMVGAGGRVHDGLPLRHVDV